VKRAVRRAAHAAALVAMLALFPPAAILGRLRTSRRRRSGERPAILRGPVPIVSIHYAARADRLLGYRSETLVYRTYRISTRGHFDRDLSRLTRIPLLGQLVPYGALLWALLRYDLFVFFFDGGLLGETPAWRLELPLLKLAGKRVIVHPYGGDARLATRTRARGGWHAYSEIAPGDEDRDEAEVAARVAALGRRADAVLGSADLVEDLPRLDGMFPFPIDVGEWKPVPVDESEVVRILHAPNHPQYKGTRHVAEAVERLKAEGEPVELLLVQGLPLHEARSLYEQAHVVVDQLLIGAYAQFAIECMAIGRPVVCYLNPRFAEHHPEWAEAPIVSATPDTIVDELRRLVRDPALRDELGGRGPGYVRRHHSLEAVGAELDVVYRAVWSSARRRER
jgi:glycosyltransferase involved in cell wall biosynthesis